MQKLEWKGPPRAGKVECNEILMLGDSMLRNINVDMMKGQKLWLFAYPGITTGQLSVQIKVSFSILEGSVIKSKTSRNYKMF